MKFANLLTSFYFEPWCIRPDKHAAMGKLLLAYMQKRIERDGSSVVGPTFEDGRPLIPQMEVMNGVALIPVHGVLGKHLDRLELLCGGCDYANVSAMVDDAEGDSNVHTIVFSINSPGGRITGLPELAAKIKNCSKRTIAFSDSECNSSAYWIASQCDEIYFSSSAQVGCIGCMVAALDTSREFEMNGWKVELFQSGELKGIGIEGKAFTEVEREFLQSRASAGGDWFRGAVRSTRPKIEEKNMVGQWFDGMNAPVLGLSDGVFDDLRDLLIAAMSVPS